MNNENDIKMYGGATKAEKDGARNSNGIEIFTGIKVKGFKNLPELVLLSDGNIYKLSSRQNIHTANGLMNGYILGKMYEGYKLLGHTNDLLYTNDKRGKILRSPITRQPLNMDDLIKLGFDLDTLKDQIPEQQQKDLSASQVDAGLIDGYRNILMNYCNPRLIYDNIDKINSLTRRYTGNPDAAGKPTELNKMTRRYIANLIQIKIHLQQASELFSIENIREMYGQLHYFDKYTDLFTSVMTESNSDLLMFSIHDNNVNSMFERWFNTIFKIEEIHPDYLMDLEMKGGNILSGNTMDLNKSSNLSGGGVCDGDMVIPTDINYADGFLVSGIVKTYDELLHDFKPYFNPGMLKMLGDIYNHNIDEFIKILKTKQDTNELDKIKDFIKIVRSYTSIPETEWNYYTSVLRYIDSYCNKLDELNIVKISNISSYHLSEATVILLREQGYIFNIPESSSDSSSPPSSGSPAPAPSLQDKEYFYTTIDNQPVTKIFDIKDVLYRFSDNSTSNRKLMPLLFDSKVEGVSRGFDANSRGLISTDMIDLSYAPGLLDPKTTGDYTKSRDFYSPGNGDLGSITAKIKGMTPNTPGTPDYREKLVRLQRLQNIDEPLAFTARRFLTDGINSFCGYFGCTTKIPDEVVTPENLQLETLYINGGAESVPDSPNPKKVRFTTNGANIYSGVNFDFPNASIPIPNPNTITLIHGDTTIQNVSEFVKFSGGIIPMAPPPSNESWNRLHTFAKAIYDGIPGDIKGKLNDGNNTGNNLLTEIIISLKSFGDSLQVYYTKRMYRHFKELGFDQLFITTTDKNVAAESLFIDSKFWIIGTGIRPHSDFYSKKIGFFGEQSFRNVLNNLPSVPDETKMDGSKAIMTNKSLMDAGKYVNSIRDTFLKISEYELILNIDINSEIPPVVESPTPGRTPLIREQLDFLGTLQSYKILNTDGKGVLTRKIQEVLRNIILRNPENPANPENLENPELLKKLSELDSFLKKTYEICKLFDIPDTGDASGGPPEKIVQSKKLLEKLDVMSDMIFKKCFSVFDCLKKFDLSLYIDKITAVKGKILAATNFKNIIDDSLIRFANTNLNEKFSKHLEQIKTDYEVLMLKTKIEFGEYMDLFNNVTIPQARGNSSRSVTSTSGLETYRQEIIDKNVDLKKLNEKIAVQEGKYNALIESYNPNKKKSTLTKILEFTKIKKTDEAKLKKYQVTITGFQQQQIELVQRIKREAEISFQKNKEKKSGTIVRVMAQTVLNDIKTAIDSLTSRIVSTISVSASSRGGKKMNKTIRHYSKKKNKKSINHRNKKTRNTKKPRKTYKKPRKTYKKR